MYSDFKEIYEKLPKVTTSAVIKKVDKAKSPKTYSDVTEEFDITEMEDQPSAKLEGNFQDLSGSVNSFENINRVEAVKKMDENRKATMNKMILSIIIRRLHQKTINLTQLTKSSNN